MKSLIVVWEGPYAWPGYEQSNGLPPLPGHSGVYLQAFECDAGYAIYAAGITSRNVGVRFKEHTIKYLSGDYTVLDVESARHGERREIWHGWGEARSKRGEFERRKAEITAAAREQLAAFRIFVADVGPKNRVLRRIEAAVMDLLYKQNEPLSRLPDRGMSLSRRWVHEDSILVRCICNHRFHGVPLAFEI